MLTIKYLHRSTPIICSCRTKQLFTKQIYFQSTIASTADKNEKKEVRSEFPLLDTKFNQYQIAYRYRRSMELLRGYLVYRLFSINFLVNNQVKIAEWGERILGARLFRSLLKLTAFGHFVGGETSQEIKPVIKSLQKYGVKPILDYSVESDDTDKSSSSSSSSSDHNDSVHDFATSKFIECIKTSYDVCGPNSTIAVKLTALIRPGVLKKFNILLKSIENRSLLPPLFELINQEQKHTEKTVETFRQSIKSYFEKYQNKISTSIILTNDEFAEIYHFLIRLNQIAQACVEHKISIMVDAEQTYFQTAINYFANELQRYYNKNNDAFIYGTYQCYLKETLASVKHDLSQAEHHNYTFAAKLVRGAYMEQERRLAQEYGYEDRINTDFEATSKMYRACLDEVFKRFNKRHTDQVRVMVASHNEDTIRYAIQKMKDFNLSHDSSLVSFASLYGMSDYVAFALANSGYNTYKYLPYGPMESLQPYLFRRAQENRAMFEKSNKDRHLHFQALKDRIFNLKM
ncbi:unnamed protein product [Rotaria magnacalcarata]|uniref:Proline dehydrogenase n=1 Tax=Rotaria magnacalcarata TaxID=392030 RepID=A0A815WH87_9BILA|nr:unnamed protein product [Rotaria magnacalcarata]CAF1683048.1 unnamed protein product [Rotaria magnacalcarata]